MEIKSVEKLIDRLLVDGKKFVSEGCKHLLSNGENYGSVLMDLRILLEDKDGNAEIVSCVAKTPPPKGVLWSIFNIPVTFKKEIAFYEVIVPTLNNFGKERGEENIMSFFAKCYGERISLNIDSDEVDADAVLLLENLRTRRFLLCNRFVGFNMEETKLILRDLAIFHAVPVAHKLQKPDEFKEKIKAYLSRDPKFHPPPDMVGNITSFLREIVSSSCKSTDLFSKIEQSFRKYLEEIVVNPPVIKEPFATMIHNDFWVNNAMVRYENGSPSEAVMLDFQGVDYNSPAHDLLFFLYTSVELPLVEQYFDSFVNYYFETFVETLNRLGSSIEEFTLDGFIQEMKFAAESQLFHILMMLQPIYMKKEEAKDLSKIEEVMGSTTENSFHENFNKKALFVMKDFNRRGWV